jgi:hypothetical protein
MVSFSVQPKILTTSFTFRIFKRLTSSLLPGQSGPVRPLSRNLVAIGNPDRDRAGLFRRRAPPLTPGPPGGT